MVAPQGSRLTATNERRVDVDDQTRVCFWTRHAYLVILLTMTTLSLADAKAHLSALVARVSGQHERVYVTVHGKPSAVLVATEDLESLEETIEILADADTMRRLHASDDELARGEVETREQLDAAMRRRLGSGS
jgi:prevent-host-death family protein